MIPKCENPTCNNAAAPNSTNTGYVRHCSRVCRSFCNSSNGKEKRKLTCLARYGATTNLVTAGTKHKIKETCLQKYGCDHAMKGATSKEKIKRSKLEKYGDETYNNRDKFKSTISAFSPDTKANILARRKNTVSEKFGVDHITQSSVFKEKATVTNLQKYGVSNPAKAASTKKKISTTMLTKFGAHYSQQHISLDSLTNLSSVLYLEAQKHRSLLDISKELSVSYHTVGAAYKKYNIERTFDGYNQSQAEIEIADYIRSLGFTVKANVRGIIGNKEIDILVQEKNIGIEYHGLFWHCEASSGKDKRYHLDKMIACKEKGIALIQIIDYEWLTKQDIVKSRIANKLGVSSRVVYGRSCQVRNVNSADAAAFLDETHIQGACTASRRLGLYVDDELVALMTFGRSRFDKKVQWELLRYSVLLHTKVIGGASKLFQYFVRTQSPTSIVSYCDLRWNTGVVYQKCGFTHIKDTDPNYWYTKQHITFESRMAYQKHKLCDKLLTFNPGLTEWDNMVANGYDRFWDCGNSVWHYYSDKQ